MLRKTILSLTVLTCLIATSISWASAPPVATPEPVVTTEPEPAVVSKSSGIGIMYPIILATGALAGVVAVNAMTHGVGTLPLSVGIVTTDPFVSPAAAAASRIFVITSGVLGAWLADSLYNSFTK